VAAANHTETAFLTVLRMAGLSLSLDVNREAVISGNSKALAVWHALADAIDQLDALVIAGLDDEAVAEAPPIVVEPEPKPEIVVDDLGTDGRVMRVFPSVGQFRVCPG
jgi:hypothetical protein